MHNLSFIFPRHFMYYTLLLLFPSLLSLLRLILLVTPAEQAYST